MANHILTFISKANFPPTCEGDTKYKKLIEYFLEQIMDQYMSNANIDECWINKGDVNIRNSIIRD